MGVHACDLFVTVHVCMHACEYRKGVSGSGSGSGSGPGPEQWGLCGLACMRSVCGRACMHVICLWACMHACDLGGGYVGVHTCMWSVWGLCGRACM